MSTFFQNTWAKQPTSCSPLLFPMRPYIFDWKNHPSKSIRFHVLPPLKNYPSKSIRFHVLPPLKNHLLKSHRFCVLPPLKNHPSKSIRIHVLPPLKNRPPKLIGFMYSPLWKITVFGGKIIRAQYTPQKTHHHSKISSILSSTPILSFLSTKWKKHWLRTGISEK